MYVPWLESEVSTSPVVPKSATRGLGSTLTSRIRDRVWKMSLQYFHRLGQVQNMFIREAFDIEELRSCSQAASILFRRAQKFLNVSLISVWSEEIIPSSNNETTIYIRYHTVMFEGNILVYEDWNPPSLGLKGGVKVLLRPAQHETGVVQGTNRSSL